MPGTLPTNYLDAILWGTSTGGAAGSAETTNTLGADRSDARVPPDAFTIAGLQISRMRQLLVSMSTYYKGGTRLQVLAQSSNPFGAGEAGFWTDNSNNPKFTAVNGTVTTLGTGGGGGTLAADYISGTSQTDQTLLYTSAKGYLLLKDNATPIGTLFEIQTSAAASLFKFDASNLTFGANKGITTIAGTGAFDFSNATGVFKTSTGANTIGGSLSGKDSTWTLDDATTNAITTILTLAHTTSGTAANNIGSGALFRAENASGSTTDAARIGGILTTATGGAEVSAVTFEVRTGGAAIAEKARFTSTGLFFNAGTSAGVGFSGSQLTLTGGTAQINWDGVAFFPLSDLGGTLGGSGNRWANVYTRRLRTAGTTTANTDYVLSGGWGSTASVAAPETGSDDTHGEFVVTSSGTGQAAGPTITLTYKDGTWTNAPKVIAFVEDTTDTSTDAKQYMLKTSSTATVLTMTFKGTPVAAATYRIRYMTLGTN